MNLLNIRFQKSITEGRLEEICSQFNTGDIIKVKLISDSILGIQNIDVWYKIRIPENIYSGCYDFAVIDSYLRNVVGCSIGNFPYDIWRLDESI